MDLDFRISRCKQLYMGCIKTKVLVHNAGNLSIFYNIHNGKNMKKYTNAYTYNYIYN